MQTEKSGKGDWEGAREPLLGWQVETDPGLKPKRWLSGTGFPVLPKDPVQFPESMFCGSQLPVIIIK